MLKKCVECGRLFSGEGDKCSKCSIETVEVNKISQCAVCGVFTLDLIQGLCRKCAVKDPDIDNFKIVRDYLYDNPKLNIRTLSLDTGVSISEINTYVVEGRLDVVSGVSFDENRRCKSCGAVIASGAYCTTCQRNYDRILETKRQLERSISNKSAKKLKVSSSGFKSI